MVIAQWNRDDVEQVDGAGGSQLHPLAVGLGVVGVILLVLVVTASSHQRERLKMMARRALQSKIKTDDGKPRSSSMNSGNLPSFARSACENGNMRLLQRWINSTNKDINARSDENLTALHYTARGGHSDCLRLLLDSSADPNMMDDNRVTPLHLAALGGHGLCVKMLLDYSANPFIEDVNRQTPFQISENTANYGCARLIQRAMAKVSSATEDANVSLRSERTHLTNNV